MDTSIRSLTVGNECITLSEMCRFAFSLSLDPSHMIYD